MYIYILCIHCIHICRYIFNTYIYMYVCILPGLLDEGRSTGQVWMACVCVLLVFILYLRIVFFYGNFAGLICFFSLFLMVFDGEFDI